MEPATAKKKKEKEKKGNNNNVMSTNYDISDFGFDGLGTWTRESKKCATRIQ